VEGRGGGVVVCCTQGKEERFAGVLYLLFECCYHHLRVQTTQRMGSGLCVRWSTDQQEQKKSLHATCYIQHGTYM
jgi:hypothetical protein